MKTFPIGMLRGLPTALVAYATFVALEEPWPWGFWRSQVLFFLTLGLGMIELSLAWNGAHGRRG